MTAKETHYVLYILVNLNYSRKVICMTCLSFQFQRIQALGLVKICLNTEVIILVIFSW